MKILHIGPTYYPHLGGAELHLKSISEGLVSRGHDVTVLTMNVKSHLDLWPGRSGNLLDVEIVGGVKVIRVPPECDRFARILAWWENIPGGWRTASWFFGVDVLEMLQQGPRTFGLIPHTVSFNADIVATMNWYWPLAYHTHLARKLKRFTLVGIPLFHTAQAWCERSIYGRMLARCDAVIVNTICEGQFATNRGARRIEVAGVGINPQGFEARNGEEIRTRYGLRRFPVVGFVGRQIEKKGVVKLIEAMRKVWEWNKEVRLVLAGPRQHHDNLIDIAIEKLSLSQRERVVHIGAFDENDKGSLFDAFDVFALPSTEESFGISYLEAWACQKPVIGARIDSTRCVIDHGVDGLLVDPDDSEDIARSLIDLLSNAEKRERLGQNGYAKTMSQYTWDKVTDKIENLYYDLMAAKTIR